MKSQPKITTLWKGNMFTEVSDDDTEEIVKLDLVGTDHSWEEWSIKELIETLQKWLEWNKTHDLSTDTGDSCKRERHWYKRDTSRGYKAQSCLYCQGDQWLEACEVKDEVSFTKRNCVATAGGGSWSEYRITAKSSLLQVQVETPNEPKWQTFNKRIESRIGVHYMQPWHEDQSLPVIIPPKIQEINLWAHFDTDSRRNFISREAVEKLNLKPPNHESRQIVTINGVQKQSLPYLKWELIVWMIERASK